MIKIVVYNRYKTKKRAHLRVQCIYAFYCMTITIITLSHLYVPWTLVDWLSLLFGVLVTVSSIKKDNIQLVLLHLVRFFKNTRTYIAVTEMQWHLIKN